ncbi:MAG: CHAD domain-containing protein [Phototrophicaceae bacterium]
MTSISPSKIERLMAIQVTLHVTLEESADGVIYDALVRGLITLLHQEEACRNGRQQSAVRNMLTTTHQLWMLAEWLPTTVPTKLAKHYQPYFSKLHERLVALDELDQIITHLLHYGHTQDRRMNVAGTLAQLDAQRLASRNRLFDYFDGDKYHTLINGLIDWLEQQTPLPTDSSTVSLRMQLPLWLVSAVAQLVRYDALWQAGVPMPYDELLTALSRYRFLLQLLIPLAGESQLPPHSPIMDELLASCVPVCQTIAMRSKLVHLPVSMLEEAQVNTLKQIRQQVRIEQDRRETEFIQAWQAVNFRQLYHDLFLHLAHLLA